MGGKNYCKKCGKDPGHGDPGHGDIDSCLIPVIKALNKGGLKTEASCCGHGVRPVWIALSDGRQVLIARDLCEAQAMSSICPYRIDGEFDLGISIDRFFDSIEKYFYKHDMPREWKEFWNEIRGVAERKFVKNLVGDHDHFLNMVEDAIPRDPDTFKTVLNFGLNKIGIDRNDIMRRFDVSSETIDRWLVGKDCPNSLFLVYIYRWLGSIAIKIRKKVLLENDI